jgi:flagellar biosynthetic protein FlhB
MTLALGLPLVAVAVVAALVAGVGQVGFAPAFKAAKPKLSHLSPKRGLTRLRPGTAGWELVRSAGKLALLVAAVWGPLRTWTTGPATARSLDAGLRAVLDQTWSLLLRGLALAALVAAADYAWNRRKVARELRMSKDEVRQEAKNSEGDPLIKGQRRRRAHELSRNRMLADVAGADVIVTNPTHLAVALRYGDGEAAPRVVAKGADRLAAKIRAAGYRHGVLVREDRPLARVLYRQCRVGAYVPAALYEAVAVVLALAYRRRGRSAA